jgi:hypothetical protein
MLTLIILVVWREYLILGQQCNFVLKTPMFIIVVLTAVMLTLINPVMQLHMTFNTVWVIIILNVLMVL